MDDRDNEAFEVRKDAAQLAKNRRGSSHPKNGEEEDYENKNYIASYSKGLKHDDNGEVDPIEYKKLLKALKTGKQEDFNEIELPAISEMKEAVLLTNPQAGFAYDLEGPDSHDLGIRKAPRINDPEAAGEMAELYWMALCRDVPFMDFDNNTLIADAVSDLSSNSNYSDFPHQEVGFLTDLGDDLGDRIFSKKFEPMVNGVINNNTIFRGITRGDIVGPYISQFLWMDVPWGAQKLEQIQHPLRLYDINNSQQGMDYLMDYKTWLAIQNGYKIDGKDFNKDDVDRELKRHIITGRDLTYYVHVDQLYQAYLHACLILSAPKRLGGLEAKVDPSLPYQDPTEYPNETGFGTFREPHIITLVTEVATRALKAVWYQKWKEHRRLRPEAFGGLIHRQLNNKTTPPLTPGLSAPIPSYPINNEILSKTSPNQILDRIKEHNRQQNNKFPNRSDLQGSYLLPQAFREGSPTHPSYGAGHATVAGACVTILKAWFKEDESIKNPVIPKRLSNPIEIRDSNNQILYKKTTELQPYTGPGFDNLTVGGELNKIAANIAIGRNWGGVHYRSDYAESIVLGEQLALGILQEQAETYNEKFACELTRFSGEKIRFEGKRIRNA
jgi:hypothetical protein